MIRLLVILCISLVLVACSATDLIPGGGTNVASNAQIGAENTQQVVGNQTQVQGDMTRDVIEAREGSVTVYNSPLWLVVVAILGWVLPTPGTMLKNLWNKIRGKKE